MPRRKTEANSPEYKKSNLKNRSKDKSKIDNYFSVISHQSSQYNSTYYDKLKKEGRLYRFLEIVASCSLRGLTKSSTVDELNKAFYDYFEAGGLTVNTFNKMLARYPDIANAYSSRTNTANANASLLKDGLMQLFMSGKMSYDQMFELMKYFDQGVFKGQNNPDYVQTKRTELVQEYKAPEGEGNNGSKMSNESIGTFSALQEMMKKKEDVNDRSN